MALITIVSHCGIEKNCGLWYTNNELVTGAFVNQGSHHNGGPHDLQIKCHDSHRGVTEVSSLIPRRWIKSLRCEISHWWCHRCFNATNIGGPP